jgi:hypothetical protein
VRWVRWVRWLFDDWPLPSDNAAMRIENNFKMNPYGENQHAKSL